MRIWGKVLALLGLAVVVGAWHAFVLWKFYGWFAVPIGTPQLSYWQIWGLAGTLNLTLWAFLPPPQKGKSATDSVADSLGRALVWAIFLAAGWVVQSQLA